MLKTLRLHNFKTFLNAEIDFHRLHLVIGRNNSGKTNLCAALQFLGATATGDLQKAQSATLGGLLELTNWALASDEMEIGCTILLEFDEEELKFDYRLVLRVASSDIRGHENQLALVVQEERLKVRGPQFGQATLLESDGHEVETLDEDAYVQGHKSQRAQTPASREATMLSKLYELDTNRRATLFRSYLGNVWYFSLSPMAMRRFWENLQPSDRVLSPSGHNLSTALFNLKNINEKSYRRVIEFVRLVAEPGLEAINFVPAPDQPPVPFVSLRYRPNASWSGLSDGTLRFLALAYIVETSSAAADTGFAGPVIIEEPENGIFPGQLRQLLEMIDDRAPRTQFIFTSHSPYFINQFDSSRKSVSLLTRNKERTEVTTPPPANLDDLDRDLLAEEYSMELFGK